MLEKIKRNFRTSLRNHMSLTILLVNLALFVCFDAIFILLTKMAFDSNLDGKVTEYTNTNVSLIDTYLDNKVVPINMILNDSSVRAYLSQSGDRTSAYRSKHLSYISTMFDILKSADGDIVNIWIASDTSALLTTNSKTILSAGDFDVSSQAWYSQLIANSANEGYRWFSSPSPDFLNPSSDRQIITIVSPILENDNLIGYAGVNLDAQKLMDKIAAMNFSDGSYPVLVNSDGIIIYPDSDICGEKFNLRSYPVSDIVADNRSLITKTFMLPDSGTVHYASYAPCTASNWRIATIFDGDVLGYNTGNFFFNTAIIIFCFNILIFLCTADRIKRELKELPAISKKLDLIKGGNYRTRINTKLTNEIGKFCDTVDTLAAEMQEKIDTIEKVSYTDSLTGLANRHKLYDYIEDYILASKDSGTRFAIMFFDIDNFKWINDTLGHNYGDEFLTAFGQRVNKVISTFGKLTRFSGDEFIALVELDDDTGRVDRIIRTLQNDFERPIDIYMDHIYATFSVGVSIYPDDAITSDLLLRNADISKNKAKERGKNRVAYYNQSQHAKIANKSIISQRLNGALDRGELFLNYQPIIATSDSEIYGFEVLIRWSSEELGNIPPVEFINIAEETGLIVDIGTWIFESACRFHKRICEAYNQRWIISINVSPVQLKQPDFISRIRRALEITEIDPSLIQVEITESMLIDFVSSSNSNVIEEMCSFGISLALDDFGTGYSSLNYLRNLPVKCLKIDKSFVDEIYQDSKDSTITNSIIDLVHSLGIRTVAEGVETEGQFASLNSMKCDLIQGFLMSKPLTEGETIEFIENYQKLFRHTPLQIDVASE